MQLLTKLRWQSYDEDSEDEDSYDEDNDGRL
jgi:hypothetical protein